MKKFIIVIIIISLVVASGGGVYYLTVLKNRSAKASQPEMQTAVVQRGNLTATISTNGTVVLPDQQKLSFGVAGTVKEVKVQNGSTVKKGDLLASLDTVPLERALAQAQANLEVAQANLDKAKNPYKDTDFITAESSIISANNSLDSAQKSLDDYMVLYTDLDFKLAESAIRDAQINLESALQDQSLNIRIVGTNVGKAYEQEIQASSTTRERLRLAYRDLLYRIYRVESLIPDTEYHLKLNPMKMGFITESAFDKNVEDAYWAWINADINYQKLLLEKEKNDVSLQNKVDKARDAVSKAQQALADMKEWPKASEIQTRKNQIETAKLALQKAEINLKEMKAGPDPLDVLLKQNQVDQSKLNLDTAKDNLDKAKLLAPFDSVIFNLTAELDQTVSAGTVLMQIVNPSKVRIDATIDEVDIARVRNGQEAVLTFDALQGVTLMGLVSNVSYIATRTSGVTNFLTSIDLDVSSGAQDRIARPTASANGPSATRQGTGTGSGAGNSAASKAGNSSKTGQTGSGSSPGPRSSASTSGAQQPGQRSPAPSGGQQSNQGGLTASGGQSNEVSGASGARQRPVLRDGMTAIVTVNTEKREGVLIVPNRTIISQGRNRIVRVKVGDAVEERPVRIGLNDGSSTEIVSGLEEGDIIIIPTPQVRTSVSKTGSNIPGTGIGKIGF